MRSPSSSSLLTLAALGSAWASVIPQARSSAGSSDSLASGQVEREGFPSLNPTKSYWQDPPHRIANLRSTPELPTNETFDYVVIGSGVSGAATAYKLLSRDPSLSILMLEARTAASGASGRNGGHCRPSAWKNIQRWITAYGEDEALKLGKMEQDCVNDVREFVRANNVSSDFTDVDSVDIYFTKETFDTQVGVVHFQRELEARRPDDAPKNDRVIFPGEQAREHFRWPEILGAVNFTAHTQNPYRTVCAMLELALEKGLNLQTNTVALGLHQRESSCGARWEVETDRGTVRGRQVVLATNAYTNAIHKGFADSKFLVPQRSQVTVVHPEAETAGNSVFERSYSYPDLHSGNNYIVVRPPGSAGAGDVIYGGSKQFSESGEVGITDDSVIHEGIARNLRAVGRVAWGHRNWGETTEVLGDWTGITCETPDGLPVTGPVPGEDGLWANVCFNGHGMAWAFRSAEALVEMMLEGEPPSWFPKPFRSQRIWEGKDE